MMDRGSSSISGYVRNDGPNPMTHSHWYHEGKNMFILTVPDESSRGMETQDFAVYRYSNGEDPLQSMCRSGELRGDDVRIFESVTNRTGSAGRKLVDSGKVGRTGEITFDTGRWTFVSDPPRPPVRSPVGPTDPSPLFNPIAPPAPAPAPLPLPAPNTSTVLIPPAPTPVPSETCKPCPEQKCPPCDKTVVGVSNRWKTAAMLLGLLSLIMLGIIAWMLFKRSKDTIPPVGAIVAPGLGPNTVGAGPNPGVGTVGNGSAGSGKIELSCEPVTKGQAGVGAPSTSVAPQRAAFLAARRYPQSGSSNYHWDP